MQVFKAVVLVSLGQQKVKSLLSDRPALEKRLSEMAKELRNQRGVRYIEGVFIRDWRSDAQGIEKAPWKPAGALVVLEARDEKRLQENIKTMWDVAKRFDQEIMVLEPLGDVDMW